jgi:trigger factor
MAKNLQHLPKSRVKLTVTTLASEFFRAFEDELSDISKDVKLQGFRPGKAPRDKVIEHVGRQRIEAGALDRALSMSYQRVLNEENLVPVAAPKVEVTSFTAPAEGVKDDTEVAVFTVEVDIYPEVNVTGYQKLKVKTPPLEKVKDEEVEKVFDYLRKQQGSLKEAEEGATIKKGDWVEIGYEGSVGGVKRTDMANQHHPLIVGEGQLIPGFEEAMVGMKKGEGKTFPISFPKEYHAKELAGKKAEFTVTIHDHREMVLPVLDAAFAKRFGHDTMEELEKAIRGDLEKEKLEQQRSQLENDIVLALLKLIKFEVPDSLVDREADRLKEDAVKQLAQMRITMEQYAEQTGQSMEKINQELREQADRNVRLGIILTEVVKAEGIVEGEGAGKQAIERLVEIATR